MSLNTKVVADGCEFVIEVQGMFDFNVLSDFKESYSEVPAGVTSVAVDLRQVEYMDSSALGMLLNMKKKLESDIEDFKLLNANTEVEKVLKISRFDKMFSIQ